MQRPIRRSDRASDSDAALALLGAGEYGVLATVGPDGLPYAVPLSYVLHGRTLYFHCATEGRKLENIAANSAVSFCVVGQTKVLPRHFATEYESVVVSGTASLVDGEEKRAALIHLLEKYSPEYIDSGLKYIAGKFEAVTVVRIEIEQVSGKARR